MTKWLFIRFFISFLLINILNLSYILFDGMPKVTLINSIKFFFVLGQILGFTS